MATLNRSASSLLEIIRRSTHYLAERGVERPRQEAEEVIAGVLNMKRLDLYLQFERPMIESELDEMRHAIVRRGKREPAAYIVGKVEFAGCKFIVNPSVLIPRPETEILVELIAQELKKGDLNGKILWDVCSGSGCIGISLKKRFPELTVYLSDVSKKALAIAEENARLNEVSVIFKQGDLLEPFQNERCDFFVSNPPYVSENEYKVLTLEVQAEPKEALVSGPSGYEFYERLSKELTRFLRPGGKGWMEIGTGQGESIKNIFEIQKWKCRYAPDWSGHDRFFFLESDTQIDVS